MIKLIQGRLDEFLKFRRWNHSDLARAMGFTEGYISHILNDAREPSAEFMGRLVKVTGLSLGELFFCPDTSLNGIHNLQKSNQPHGNNAQPNPRGA